MEIMSNNDEGNNSSINFGTWNAYRKILEDINTGKTTCDVIKHRKRFKSENWDTLLASPVKDNDPPMSTTHSEQPKNFGSSNADTEILEDIDMENTTCDVVKQKKRFKSENADLLLASPHKDNDLSMSTCTNKQPKKRGRKPKSLDLEIMSNKDERNNSSLNFGTWNAGTEILENTNTEKAMWDVTKQRKRYKSKNSDLLLPSPLKDNDLPMSTTNSQRPKKRGRKPKSFNMDTPLHNTNSEQPNKRGRKPKSPNMDTIMPNNDERNNSSLYFETSNADSEILGNINMEKTAGDVAEERKGKADDPRLSSTNNEQPKKRGRKPKSLSVEIMSNNNVKNNSSLNFGTWNLETEILGNNPLMSITNNEQPKKRGRKPKYLNMEIMSHKNERNNSKMLNDLRTEKTQCDELDKNRVDDSLKDNIDSQTKKRGRKSKSFATKLIGNDSEVNDNLNSSQQDPELQRKRGRPKSAKIVTKLRKPYASPKITKINVAKESTKKSSVRSGKLTKATIKASSLRKIPKNRLDNALEMFGDEDHPIWEDRNISCNACIHRHWEPRSIMISNQNMKLKYARQFLLRRDWYSLAKVLCLSSSDSKDNNYYPLLVKYATLCLAQTDKEQFNKFVQFLVNMDDGSAVIKKCTKISLENEE